MTLSRQLIAAARKRSDRIAIARQTNGVPFFDRLIMIVLARTLTVRLVAIQFVTLLGVAFAWTAHLIAPPSARARSIYLILTIVAGTRCVRAVTVISFRVRFVDATNAGRTGTCRANGHTIWPNETCEQEFVLMTKRYLSK